jgi:hypothetical protein
VTSDGTAYGRFRRALRMGNLAQVRAAAAELPQVGLDDALAVVLLMDAHDDERYERAAVRWLARLVSERSSVGLADLGLGLTALEALPENREAAISVLTEICARHGVRMATGRFAARPAPGG